MDYREIYPAPLRALSSAIDLVLVALGSSICLLTFINAALRGLAGFDFSWSLEAVSFMLLWVTFLGAAAAVARGAHMRVTEIVAAVMSARPQRWLALVIDAAVAVLLVTLSIYGADIALHNWAQRTTVLYWPVGLFYASMPVGMLLSLLFHAYNSYADAYPRGAAASEPDGHRLRAPEQAR